MFSTFCSCPSSGPFRPPLPTPSLTQERSLLLCVHARFKLGCCSVLAPLRAHPTHRVQVRCTSFPLLEPPLHILTQLENSYVSFKILVGPGRISKTFNEASRQSLSLPPWYHFYPPTAPMFEQGVACLPLQQVSFFAA